VLDCRCSVGGPLEKGMTYDDDNDRKENAKNIEAERVIALFRS
jgi:hypothetical protein